MGLQVFAKINKFSYFCTLYNIGMIVIVPPAFNVAPIYASYKAGAFRGRNIDGIDVELAVYYHFPGFDCMDYFYLLTFINMYFSFIGCVAIFSIDAFLALIVFQIIGHFQILKHNMENLPRPKTETAVYIRGMIKNNVSLRWYDDDENKFINTAIIQMMNHHKYIMR